MLYKACVLHSIVLLVGALRLRRQFSPLACAGAPIFFLLSSNTAPALSRGWFWFLPLRVVRKLVSVAEAFCTCCTMCYIDDSIIYVVNRTLHGEEVGQEGYHTKYDQEVARRAKLPSVIVSWDLRTSFLNPLLEEACSHTFILIESLIYRQNAPSNPLWQNNTHCNVHV